MLIGIRVQTFKKLRSGSLFELNGGDKSQYVIPVFFDQFGINVGFRQNLKALGFIDFAFFKGIEPVFGKFFKPKRESKAEQMGHAEHDFRKTLGISRVDVTFNRFVMEQSINHICGFALGAADDGRVE